MLLLLLLLVELLRLLLELIEVALGDIGKEFGNTATRERRGLVIASAMLSGKVASSESVDAALRAIAERVEFGADDVELALWLAVSQFLDPQFHLFKLKQSD